MMQYSGLNRNGSDSSDQVVKITDLMGCSVHACRKNLRNGTVVKISDS